MLCRFSYGFIVMSISMEQFDDSSFLLVYINNYIGDHNTVDYGAVPFDRPDIALLGLKLGVFSM